MFKHTPSASSIDESLGSGNIARMVNVDNFIYGISLQLQSRSNHGPLEITHARNTLRHALLQYFQLNSG